MHEWSHREVAELISRLVREERVGKEEMEKAVNHIASCPRCLEELDITMQIMSGGASGLESMSGTGPACRLFRELLPQYVEAGEETARTRYPWLWRHLEGCPECKKEEEMLRWLVDIKEELGPAPAVNTVIKDPAGPGEPLVVRLARRLRVYWDKKKSILEYVPGGPFSDTAKGLYSVLENRAWTPAYLGPDDSEVQEINCSLPGEFCLAIEIIFSGGRYDLTATPRLADSPAGRVEVTLLDMDDHEPVLVASEQRQSGQGCLFAGLHPGSYGVRAESRLKGREKRWEIYIDLGQGK